MNAEAIVGSTLKGLAFLGIIGATGGLLSGLVSERGKVMRKDTVKRTIIPESLLPYDYLVDAFLVLGAGAGKRGDTKSLKSAAGRCGAIIGMHNRIKEAHPSTVDLGCMTEVVKVETSLFKYLHDFYRNSDVARVHEGRAVVPVNKELLEAHNLLLETIEGYKLAIHNLVIEKKKEWIAMRGNDTADKIRADLVGRM